MYLRIVIVVFCLVLGMGNSSWGEEVQIVPSGSQWSYFKGTQAPSANPIFWRLTSFDESSWSQGTAPFYYGGNITSGTLLSDMRGNYSSVYLRKTIFLPQGTYKNFSLRGLCDDGFILWINGKELLRDNVADGIISYDGVAQSLVTVGEWKTYEVEDLGSVLRPGQENVIALHAFNLSLGGSGDFAMDLELKAEMVDDYAAPLVTGLLPKPGSMVADPLRMTVTFSEGVSNVISSVLLCDGQEAKSVKQVSSNQYIFEFLPHGSEGQIQLSWNPAATICDESPNANVFVPPSESWFYDISADAPTYGVQISEILASNDTGLKTRQGQYSDWIEIYNPESEPVDLGGWYLTDSKKDLTQWQFPLGTTLKGGGYLVVFCDGKSESSSSSEYHTSFSLSSDGEYLALVFYDGETIIHEFSPSYPAQRVDVSYGQGFYYETPTPGAANNQGVLEPVQDVIFSEPRGYKTNSFQLLLSTATEGAEIYYTLDGTVPTRNSLRYVAPLWISKITHLRAIALKAGHLDSRVVTRTWLFMEEVLTQPTSTPKGWPRSYEVNGHKLEYGMNSSIVGSSKYSKDIRKGLTNISTLSIVTDLKNLFDPSIGIYVNQSRDGEEWERPISLELIDPSGGDEFQIDSGIRIRGAASRSSGNPKHSFRLFFRSKYGGSLKFPLFDTEGVTEFDKVDLRTSQNYSWAFEQTPYDTFIRETFARDAQRDVGMPYTRSRYYHLYINGQYWGLYQTQERSETSYAESYLGGNKEDWDLIKTDNDRSTVLSEGTAEAFNNLYNIGIVKGFAGVNATNYWYIKGLNSDGTRNPSFPVYLDEPNLQEYMLNVYAVCDPDSPIAYWGTFANNIFGLYNRVEPSGFKWFRHDSEHAMWGRRAYGYGEGLDMVNAGWDFNAQFQFNPMRLHQKLMDHPDYRMNFIDLIQKRMLNAGGEFTLAKNVERWNKRRAEINEAIVVESARWGHGYTREDWLKEGNYVLGVFFVKHPTYLMQQFKSRGWFPQVSAPVLSRVSGKMPSNEDPLKIESSYPIYCTTDGTDPRLPGGGINPNAVVLWEAKTGEGILLPQEKLSNWKSSLLKIRARGGSEWSALAEADFTEWGSYQDLRITKLMYAAATPEDAAARGWDRDDFAWIELQNTGSGVLRMEGVRFTAGITYTFPALNLAAGERILLVKNEEAFSSLYETSGLNVVSGYTGNLARKGETLKLETPEGENILTFTYSNKWYPSTDQGGYALVVLDTGAPESDWSLAENWRPSVSEGGSPGIAEVRIPLISGVSIAKSGALCFNVEDVTVFSVEVSRDTKSWNEFTGWHLEEGRVVIEPNALDGSVLFFRIRL